MKFSILYELMYLFWLGKFYEGFIFGVFGGYGADCPGPQSESAGKSDACQGCPNQEVCATAPKGPDPGSYPTLLFIR